MKTTIYANYGVLAADKRCIYTVRSTDEAKVSEPVCVEIPESFAPYVGAMDDVVVTIDGVQYLLQNVLCGNEYPCIVDPSPYNGGAITRLHVLDATEDADNDR